jgi:hypothetical protein
MEGLASLPRRSRLVLALYALVLLASPLLHHDLDCHLKTPAHCNACTANPLAPRIETGVRLVAAGLPEAGTVEIAGAATSSRPVESPHPGRAPPA